MNSTERRALLDEYFALQGARFDVKARERRSELLRAYEEGLPRVPFSRCPFTEAVFAHSLDTGGLDGLWWDYDNPIRAIVEELPATYFALTGALRVNGRAEPAPFDRKPGPELPFVVPRILLHDDVKAVVSHVGIGGHDAYPVVYFASPIPPKLARFNDWGANIYTYESAKLADGWDSIEEEIEELDFDLARWIDSGDLFWIAADDANLRLGRTVVGCPYLDLEGTQEWTVLEATETGPPRKAPVKKPAAAAAKTPAKPARKVAAKPARKVAAKPARKVAAKPARKAAARKR